LGLDVEGLLRAVEAWQEWIERGEGEPPEPPRVALVDESAFI
jgi:hypothetical protein